MAMRSFDHSDDVLRGDDDDDERDDEHVRDLSLGFGATSAEAVDSVCI